MDPGSETPLAQLQNGVAPLQKRFRKVQETLGRPLLAGSKRHSAPSHKHFRDFIFSTPFSRAAGFCNNTLFLFIYTYIYIYTHLPSYLSIYLSVCLSIYLSIYLSFACWSFCSRLHRPKESRACLLVYLKDCVCRLREQSHARCRWQSES